MKDQEFILNVTITGLIVAIIILLMTLRCTEHEQPSQPHPMHCYKGTVVANSTTGEVISTTFNYYFVYELSELAIFEREQGLRTDYDTLRHLTITNITFCTEPDIK